MVKATIVVLVFIFIFLSSVLCYPFPLFLFYINGVFSKIITSLMSLFVVCFSPFHQWWDNTFPGTLTDALKFTSLPSLACRNMNYFLACVSFKDTFQVALPRALAVPSHACVDGWNWWLRGAPAGLQVWLPIQHSLLLILCSVSSSCLWLPGFPAPFSQIIEVAGLTWVLISVL